MMMSQLVRTNARNHDFISLVACLDADLAFRDGTEHAFYDRFNKVDSSFKVVMSYKDQVAAACGGFKEQASKTAEIKRMYVIPEYRGKGLASLVLKELEKWACELGFQKCLLETGKRQPEAIRLYLKNGYRVIPNFGPYKGVTNSICFEKALPNPGIKLC